MRKRFFILMVLLLPGIAVAHPHVFINANINFVFSSGKLTALDVHWRFDPMFSSQVIMSCDHNRDRRITGSEVAAVRRGFFRNLKNHSYFLFLWVDKVYRKNHRVSRFTAGVGRDGNVYYKFRIPVRVSGAGTHKIKAMHSDPSLFVAFLSKAGSGKVLGNAPAGTRVVNNAKVQFQLNYRGR